MMGEKRFSAEQIKECEVSTSKLYIVELKDGRIIKIRKEQLSDAEKSELAEFFLR